MHENIPVQLTASSWYLDRWKNKKESQETNQLTANCQLLSVDKRIEHKHYMKKAKT